MGFVVSELLTETTLFDLLGNNGKHPEHLCHNLDENVRHSWSQWDLFCVDIKTREEIADAVEEVDEGVVACTYAIGGLARHLSQ